MKKKSYVTKHLNVYFSNFIKIRTKESETKKRDKYTADTYLFI